MSASGKAYDDSNSEASLVYRATQKSPVLKENKIKRKKEKEKKKATAVTPSQERLRSEDRF